jgi:uncharacterized lipoprotein YmbA
MKPTLAMLLVALSLAGLLAACASPAPPPALYQLRGAPPAPVQAVPGVQVLQLLLPVALPEALQRDALLLPQGQAGLQVLTGHRWAEPLADAVPRLLRQDLAALLGQARVWSAPLPAGVAITRQCRVEILSLLATPDRTAVVLQARWTLSDPSGRGAPVATTTQISAPSGGPDVDALVAAHRLALWRLAEQVAQAVR